MFGIYPIVYYFSDAIRSPGLGGGEKYRNQDEVAATTATYILNSWLEQERNMIKSILLFHISGFRNILFSTRWSEAWQKETPKDDIHGKK